MNEDDWSDLVALVRSGGVVPVVGPELLALTVEDGTRTSLEALIAREFAQALDPKGDTPPARVRDVANAYLAAKGHRARRMLRPTLSHVLEGLKQAPPALQLLAQITDLKVFVSVTPDALLQRALNQTRFSGRDGTIALTNAPSVRPGDLSLDRGATTVFYPFGRQADGDFAITEEETLEFLFDIVSQPRRFEGLFGAMGRSHLLFLGCNFPDWLTRFWIRALTGKRLQSQGREQLEVIADRAAREDKNLVMFLKRTEIQVFDEGGADDFVSELHRRWIEHREPDPKQERGARAQIFVSYSTTDTAAAERVNALLRERGLETWFDVDAIESGRSTLDELRRSIQRSILFVPILSKGAATRPEGYYREEWHSAIELARRRSDAIPFIHPVLIDDVDPKAEGIPTAFAELIGEPARGGEISERFTDRLRALVRKAQQ